MSFFNSDNVTPFAPDGTWSAISAAAKQAEKTSIELVAPPTPVSTPTDVSAVPAMKRGS